MATFVNECVEMLSVIFVFCIFWSYVQSYFHMFLVVYRSQSPYARSLQSKKWMTTHGFAFHTLNIVATVCQRKSSRERACTRNAKLLRQLVGESIVVRSCFCWGVWQILCATSKGCHLPRDQQRQHSGDMMSPCHTHCEIRRCFYDASCACHGASCVSCACHFVSSFGGEEWQCRSDGRTLWPRSPWLCHGPQTSCKAFLASTDSLRPNAKRKELFGEK